MKALSITSFWPIKPKLPFRFKTHFYTGFNDYDSILNIALTNITLPKMEGKASEGTMYLGNTIFTVQTWSIGSRKLEITFEETDAMDITNFLDSINEESWGKAPYRITIAIEEFDDKMRFSKSTGYVCHLASFVEPQFKRDGQAAQVTMTITFIIDAIIDEWDESKVVIGETKAQENDEFNEEAIFKDNSTKNNQGVKWPGSEGNFGSNSSDTGNNTTGGGNAGGTGATGGAGGTGGTTKDFNVSKKETDDVFAKIQQSPYKDKVSKEDLQAVQIENAKRMEKAYGEFERLMKENGYNVSINAYNDTGHELGIGTESGSHLLGQKIDLTMMDKNNNKLTPSNMKQEDLDKIVELAHQAGLTPNWETTGKTGSGWGDFALAEAKSIDKQGNVVDLTTRTWTGEKTAYNTGSKSYQGMGTA